MIKGIVLNATALFRQKYCQYEQNILEWDLKQHDKYVPPFYYFRNAIKKVLVSQLMRHNSDHWLILTGKDKPHKEDFSFFMGMNDCLVCYSVSETFQPKSAIKQNLYRHYKLKEIIIRRLIMILKFCIFLFRKIKYRKKVDSDLISKL